MPPDSLLRLFIDAASGGALVLPFATRLLPRLHTLAGDLDVEKPQDFAMLPGRTAGSVEHLGPSMLEEQGGPFTGGE